MTGNGKHSTVIKMVTGGMTMFFLRFLTNSWGKRVKLSHKKTTNARLPRESRGFEEPVTNYWLQVIDIYIYMVIDYYPIG